MKTEKIESITPESKGLQNGRAVKALGLGLCELDTVRTPEQMRQLQRDLNLLRSLAHPAIIETVIDEPIY